MPAAGDKNASPSAANGGKAAANTAASATATPKTTTGTNAPPSPTIGGKTTANIKGGANPILQAMNVGKAVTNAIGGTDPIPPATNASGTPPNATNGGSPAANAAGAKVNTASTAKGRTPGSNTVTINSADIAAAANVLYPGAQQPATPSSASKTLSTDSNGDTLSTGITGDTGINSKGTDLNAAAVAAGQAQAAANPAQPIAAAIVLNTPADTPPTQTNPSAANLTITASTKGRVTPALPVDDLQNAASAQDATDAAPAKPTASPTDNTASTAPRSPAEPAETHSPDGSSPPQAAVPAIDNATAPSAGPVIANASHATAQPAGSSTSTPADTAPPASNGQGATSAAKADIAGLPNFGFTASSAPPASTTPAVAPSGAAPAAPVSISGLAVAISARALAGSNQFEITLAPPELGRINVQLKVDGNGQMTSHMTVDRPDTLQLLQSQQPQLQSALEQAGLKTADNGLQFSLGGQSFAGQNNGSGSQTAPAQLVVPEPELTPIAATQIYTRGGIGTGIDIRV